MNKIVFAATIAFMFGCNVTKNADQPCVDPAKVDPEGICTMQYQPVCGCDGKTYGNDCEAEKAGLTSWEPGECK